MGKLMIRYPFDRPTGLTLRHCPRWQYRRYKAHCRFSWRADRLYLWSHWKCAKLLNAKYGHAYWNVGPHFRKQPESTRIEQLRLI